MLKIFKYICPKMYSNYLDKKNEFNKLKLDIISQYPYMNVYGYERDCYDYVPYYSSLIRKCTSFIIMNEIEKYFILVIFDYDEINKKVDYNHFRILKNNDEIFYNKKQIFKLIKEYFFNMESPISWYIYCSKIFDGEE